MGLSQTLDVEEDDDAELQEIAEISLPDSSDEQAIADPGEDDLAGDARPSTLQSHCLQSSGKQPDPTEEGFNASKIGSNVDTSIPDNHSNINRIVEDRSVETPEIMMDTTQATAGGFPPQDQQEIDPYDLYAKFDGEENQIESSQ